MSTRLAVRMSLAPFLVIACVALMCRAEEPARADAGIGIEDNCGLFTPKARVTQGSSRIVISKLEPNEKLGNIEIRFIAKTMEPSLSWTDIFLQWHKSDGPGRLWPLESQKSFDRSTGIYRGTWNTSSAFTIVDKSGRRIFDKYPWHRFVEFRINGRRLHSKKPMGGPQAPRLHLPMALKVETDIHAETTTPAVVPRVLTRAPARGERRPFQDYQQKYDQLLQRIEELERSVDSLRKRSYLWSALFALLGGVLAGAGLLLTFLLPQRYRHIGATAQTVVGKLRLRPAYKSQRAG